jgi:hypothetical protein
MLYEKTKKGRSPMSASINPDIITDGLVLCLDAGNSASYPGSGSTWYDLSGNANHVTLYNSVSFSNNKFLNGDATNAYGRTTNELDLTGLSAITVISVFKKNTSTGLILYEHTINWNTVNSYNGVNYGGFGLALDTDGNTNTSNLNHMQLRGNTGYSGKNFASNNTENQHWSVIHDFSSAGASETSAYYKGILLSGSGGQNSNNTGAFVKDYLYLWSRAGTSGFNDTFLSILMIYNRALTSTEISQNYNAIKGRYGL